MFMPLKSVTIRDLSKKLDLILCLYEGSGKRFVSEMNRIKRSRCEHEKITNMSIRTLKDWQNNSSQKKDGYYPISELYSNLICELLGVRKDVFEKMDYHVFFKEISNKVSDPLASYKSFVKNGEYSVDITNLCGDYFIYYPSLDGTKKISKGIIKIYGDNKSFKVSGYFKPGKQDFEYIGVVASCNSKLYLIIENIKSPLGISLMILNKPSDHDKYRPFHGVLVSVSSVDMHNCPTASMVYIRSVDGFDCNDNEKCKMMDNVGINEIDEIRDELGEGADLLMKKKLDGFVLQAKASDLK